MRVAFSSISRVTYRKEGWESWGDICGGGRTSRVPE